jgi:probable rRNA maturation factor
VSYIFCTDNFLLELNQKFLGHNTLTDILTFVISEKKSPVIGEIYISIERVKENAFEINANFSKELVRVMIHGILHLCGYEDHSAQEKKIMRHREDYYLFKYGFT